MEINADFTERVVVRFDETPWVASPMPGVERKMLDRIGGEVARATSIVRFAPGSAFSPHTHDGGEEYLVLDGVFQDEEGDFAVGSYVRNPPTSRHTPAAADGATIFVKLHQFDPADRTAVHVRAGQVSAQLHEDERESVRILQLAPSAETSIDGAGGLEVFVIAGAVTEGGDALTGWDWLRLPMGSTAHLSAGREGATLWLKTGHLAHVTAGPVAA